MDNLIPKHLPTSGLRVVAQLVKNFPTYYGIWRFAASDHHWSLS